MKDWIDKQVRAGAYSSPSDYVLDLIQRDREGHEVSEQVYTIDELRRLLAEAAADDGGRFRVADVRKTGRRIAAANGWLDERS